MSETVLPEGWVVAAAPRVIVGRGTVCILKMVSKEAGSLEDMLDKMIKIDGRSYSIIGYSGVRAVDLTYEFALIEFHPLEGDKKKVDDVDLVNYYPDEIMGDIELVAPPRVSYTHGLVVSFYTLRTGTMFPVGTCLTYKGKKYWVCGQAPELMGNIDVYVRKNTPDAKQETVDHPSHYGGEANVYEAIKVIEALGWGPDFCLGNCLKYLMRAGKKGKSTELEDLEKARWYLDRRIQQLKSLT